MCADTSANRPLPDAAAVRPSPLGTASTRPARVVRRRAQRVGIAITSDTTRLETSFRVFLPQWNGQCPWVPRLRSRVILVDLPTEPERRRRSVTGDFDLQSHHCRRNASAAPRLSAYEIASWFC